MRDMITKRDATIADFLRSVPVFIDLKGSSLEILFEFLEERKWEVGEHICNEGEMGRTLYVIREGEVEVLRRSATGNIFILSSLIHICMLIRSRIQSACTPYSRFISVQPASSYPVVSYVTCQMSSIDLLGSLSLVRVE